MPSVSVKMLRLTARSGAARLRPQTRSHIARAVGNEQHKSLAFPGIVTRRPLSSSPFPAQQAAVAAANIKAEDDVGNTILPDQKPAAARGDPYWQKLKLWKDATEDEFLSYKWQVSISSALL